MKLFLVTGSHSQSFSFNDFPIVIGSAPSSHVAVPHTNLIHLRLIEEGGTYYALNEANDPFVSLNGLPFRKKKLSDHDIIELNSESTLRVEFSPHHRPVLIKEEPTKTEPAPPPQLGKISGFDPIGLGKSLKVTCTIASVVLIFSVFAGSAFYTRIAEHTEFEEMTAAEGVADIAMSFKHAQVHNLRPKKHNWSDPEFIKNNLSAVTTKDCTSIHQIDTHGQFANCPYLLRTYASNDFSHFIVVAQPNPSVWQWLIPRRTIVVDSHLMELRKIQDVRTLNRMLINANVLDSPKSIEVTDLIEHGELIPLTTVAASRVHQGFTPPKALALMHPGAENRIYNAPRYHHFGESIVKRALSLGAHSDNPAELARLRQEMEVLSRFPDTILYTSQSMDTAMQTRRALATILPECHFLLASLKYNREGNIVSSNLILDQAPSEIVMNDEAPVTQEWFDVQLILLNAARKLEENKLGHTLQNQLFQLSLARQEALKSTTEPLVQALLAYASPEELKPLLDAFTRASKEQDSLITAALITLYKESLPMPFDQYLQTVSAAGLISWVPNNLR